VEQPAAVDQPATVPRPGQITEADRRLGLDKGDLFAMIQRWAAASDIPMFDRPPPDDPVLVQFRQTVAVHPGEVALAFHRFEFRGGVLFTDDRVHWFDGTERRVMTYAQISTFSYKARGANELQLSVGRTKMLTYRVGAHAGLLAARLNQLAADLTSAARAKRA
jgi:hypothetical protein